MPVSSMLYGLLAGTSLVMVLNAFGFSLDVDSQLNLVATVQIILVVAVLLTVLSLLHGAKHGSKGAQQSYEILTKDFLSRPFLYGVIGIGIILPFLILMFAPVNFITTLTAAGGVLLGFYLYRVLIFKAGVLDPILSPADIFGR